MAKKKKKAMGIAEYKASQFEFAAHNGSKEKKPNFRYQGTYPGDGDSKDRISDTEGTDNPSKLLLSSEPLPTLHGEYSKGVAGEARNRFSSLV